MIAVQKNVDRLIQVAGMLLGLLFMFLPLVLVYRYQMQQSEGISQRGAEAAVGVAVILRTTFRRLLRASTSNLLRTSVGTLSRTGARTMTRRLARTASRFILGVLTVRPLTESDDRSGARWRETAVNWFSIALGFVALALSFAYVASALFRTGNENLASLTPNRVYSIAELSLCAACPLLVYAAVAYWIARYFGSRIRVYTAMDGLLLQAYFAGAGSFLPMTTDIEFEADERTRFKISTGVLIILYVAHLLLQRAATMVPDALPLSAFFLVYCFVYGFPIPPLEGFWIWKGSRFVWVLVWVPILISFITSLPMAFVSVL